MLYLVLTLVIVAFGLLIAALTTANTLWAWVSVAISVVAAVLLVMDWARSRRRVAATSVRHDEAPAAVEPPPRRHQPGGPVAPPEPAEATSEIPAAVEPVTEPPAPTEVPVADATGPADEGGEPGEEATDAADLLIVSELGVEVRVVDEHPRYHLGTCGWLTARQTIPLPVSEARSLGFTPCSRCGPDALLAAQHRASRGAKK
jgi:hypothetical protein